jgi:hypothetical protein
MKYDINKINNIYKKKFVITKPVKKDDEYWLNKFIEDCPNLNSMEDLEESIHQLYLSLDISKKEQEISES